MCDSKKSFNDVEEKNVEKGIIFICNQSMKKQKQGRNFNAVNSLSTV